MTRTIVVIARMRALALEEARRELAARLAEAAAAELAAQQAHAALGHEIAVAASLRAQGIAAFAAWLPRGRSMQAAADSAMTLAQAASAMAGQRLGEARAAAEAVDRIMATQAEQARLAGLKREQQVLDELGQRRPG